VRDRISVEGLRARTIVGVHEWERRERQDVSIDLDLEVDLGPAATSDDLAETVDYGALSRAVVAFAETSRCHLLERLAGSIADLVLEHSARVHAVTVRVDKPNASRLARTVAVRLRRERA
jgi:FolB domain-containing protein